jgi:L-2-hydroxycarboxylate dehydrogenase (NAD+)
LGGVLNGAAFGKDVVDFTAAGSQKTNTGQFVVAIDVARFIPPEVFAAEMDRHIRDLRASPKLPGFDSIRTPGEDRQRRREERTRNGVALPPTLVKQLDDLAANLKITPLGAR